MKRKLRLWNGRPYGVLSGEYWKPLAHVYVAAYSMRDARRVCVEVGLQEPSANEVRVFWSECWGNAMQGITPERGVWVEREQFRSKPVRITEPSDLLKLIDLSGPNDKEVIHPPWPNNS